jgi:4-amino-4-deoxy-L-arabinose transferase-like glycosyltransferase
MHAVEEPITANDVPAAMRRRRGFSSLAAIMIVGLVVRMALAAWVWDEPLNIGDEQDYNALAVSLVETGRYANESGQLISLRPPLYPAFLAGLYHAFGAENHNAVRVVQSGLGLLTVLLVYALAKGMYNERVATWAAALCCFYPSLLGYQNLLLTETLFAFLVCTTCLCLQRFAATTRPAWLAAFGVALGLATLTRSVFWLFPPFLFVYMLYVARGVSWPRRIAYACLPIAVFALTIAPWAVRNTRLQKTFVTVDVMGGRNFMMGNYEHTPLYRAWDAISIDDERAWFRVLAAEGATKPGMTQGQIDKAAMRRTVAYVLENPGLTAQRDVVKFFNFWQLERSIVAGLGRGYWGNLPTWGVLLVMVVIFGSYTAAMASGVMAFAAAPPVARRLHWFLLLVVGFVCAVHTAVFGHSRYHLALMPLVSIYSARFFADPALIWSRRRSVAFWSGMAVCLLLIGGWAYEIVFVELERFRVQILS